MKTSILIVAAGVIAGLLLLVAGSWIYERSFATFDEVCLEEAAFSRDSVYAAQTVGQPVTPTVATDVLSHNGEPVEVACMTCHSTRAPAMNRKSEDLDLFHQGLVVQHGDLSCLSCHNPENYDTLRLADGKEVGFENTMQLCAQCHGPQSRDYQRGSHGGMTGYWDLSRGPRQRNACTVCHDAHAPAYPQLMPVFPPKDIIPPENESHAEH